MRLALVALSAVALASLASCSNPVPVVADGAFYLQTIQDDPIACHIASHTAQVGVVDGQNRNTVISDGMAMTKVSCSVEGTTNFNVYGLLDDTAGNSGNFFEMLVGSISLDATEANPAHGSAQFSAPWTAGAPYGGPCDFWVEPNTKGRIDNANGAGKVWVSFSCSGLTAGMSTCPVKTGYAIFENCLTDASAM